MKEFRAFITRGNVIDLAVAFIMGAAFTPIISTLVNGIIMPPIGLALGKVDFSNLFVVLKEGTTPGPYASLAAAQSAGAVVITYGLLVNVIITFLIIAAVLFFFVVRPITHFNARQAAKVPKAEPTTKECPYCFSAIPVKATRCPNCTSQLAKTA